MLNIELVWGKIGDRVCTQHRRPIVDTVLLRAYVFIYMGAGVFIFIIYIYIYKQVKVLRAFVFIRDCGKNNANNKT